jgi:hypothetical protein
MARAAAGLVTSCRAENRLTLVGRLDAERAKLRVLRQGMDAVRTILATFEDLLNYEAGLRGRRTRITRFTEHATRTFDDQSVDRLDVCRISISFANDSQASASCNHNRRSSGSDARFASSRALMARSRQ